jgi:hypothetical protein
MTSFSTAQALFGRLSLPDRAETGSHVECAAWAAK